ncbi:exodeoxyribonuclease I [Chromobacterium sp. IIBBL 290-4]|uniref:exodeoxyribonuclease I n=1 Tax=Chromobacterium sp. IIBBL 290-4 TaxID=2953890 RepID=UPI0020B6869E|nr:exodeoxyribonuclease I [Chromobacterium sp. IIBBL 290-4]UTH74754.1 exodeoxyribonuclease I [Chromobacterium sp. IIBBL 290-4]
MSHTFFWHDYETFGAVPRQDRPSQFAGIRTDAELNEIGEPVMLYCSPAPDYLPTLQACLLTGITPQLCAERGVAEHEFAGVIERELATPGTIGVGYNSLRFDDEVTRFLFWRNLIDPYAREWQNNCGRWDLLDLARAAYALRPEGINWPKHDDGRPSFKLEHLSAANGLEHDAAHDALSDVRATIALARLIRQHQPKLFDFYLTLRKKDAVKVQLSLHDPKPVLHVSGMYGPERGNLAVVWPLAQHPTNGNEVIVWDLARDPSELRGLSADAIRQRMFSRTEDLPEGLERLPIKTIHINKSPFVVANLKALSEDKAARWGVDFAAVQRHADIAKTLPDLNSLWRKVYQREAGEPQDVDQNLYGGFVSNNDRRVLQKMRRLSGPQLAGEMALFEDPQLAELLFRYRARNFPDTLAAAEKQRWQTLCRSRVEAGMPSFLQEWETLQATELSETQQQLLRQVADYADQLRA